MATPTVSLPDDHRDFGEQGSVRGGHDAEGDLRTLIVGERKRLQDAKIKSLLQEALDEGPSTPMTREDWDAIGREGRARLGDRAR